MASSKTKSKMLPKLNPQDPHRTDFLSGTFVIAGLTIVALVILIFTISKIPYRVDPNLPIPTLDNTNAYTNEDTIDVTGDGIPGEKIALYINDKLQNKTVIVDEYGTFEFSDIVLPEEGEYSYQTSTIKGSILKKRSEYSNKVKTIVDRTAPSKEIEVVFPKDTDMDETIISGNSEKNAYVILERGIDEYETKSNKEGFFQFDNIPLNKGDNTFYVSIKDEAGNKVLSSSQIKINYKPGDVNGDGAYSDLPESAGELDDALNAIAQQKLMLVFGLLSLVIFIGSSIYIFNLKKKDM